MNPNMYNPDGVPSMGPTKKALVKRDFVTEKLVEDLPFTQYVWTEISAAATGATLNFDGMAPGEYFRIQVLEKAKKFRVQQFAPMTAAQAALKVDANAGYIWTVKDLQDKQVPSKLIGKIIQGAVGASETYFSIAGKVRIQRHADDAYSVFYGENTSTRVPPTSGMNLVQVIDPAEDPMVWQVKDLVSHGVPAEILGTCKAKMQVKDFSATKYQDASGSDVIIHVKPKCEGFEVLGYGNAKINKPLSRMGEAFLGWNHKPGSLIECQAMKPGEDPPSSTTYVWTKDQLLARGLEEKDLPGDKPGNCKVRYSSRTYDRIDIFTLLSGSYQVYVNGCEVEHVETELCLQPLPDEPLSPGSLTMLGNLLWSDDELKKANVPPFARAWLERVPEVYYVSGEQKDVIRIIKFSKDAYQVQVGPTIRVPSPTLDLKKNHHNVALWNAFELIEAGVPPEMVTMLDDNVSVAYLGKSGLYYTLTRDEGGGYLVRRHRDTVLCYPHKDQEIAASQAVIAELHKLLAPPPGAGVAKHENGLVCYAWEKHQLLKRSMPEFVFDQCDLKDHGGVCTYMSDFNNDVLLVTKVDVNHYTVLRNNEPVSYSDDVSFVGHAEEFVPLDPDWVWSHYVLTEANVPSNLVNDLKSESGKIGSEVTYISGLGQNVRIWKVAPDGYHVTVDGSNEKPNVKLDLGAVKIHKTADGFKIPIGPSVHDGLKIPLSKIPEGPDPEKVMFTLTDLRRVKVPSQIITQAMDLTEPGTYVTYLMHSGQPVRVQAAPEGHAGRWVVVWNNKFMNRHEILDLSGKLPRKRREPKPLTPLQQRFANITSQLNTKRRRRKHDASTEGEAEKAP